MAQRAKMSDSSRRHGMVETADILRCAVYAPKSGTLEREQALALAEARAILAETEPAAGASFYVRDARGLSAGDALAAALRAFVEG